MIGLLILIIPFAILLLLLLPPAIRKKSWKVFSCFILGVLFPLFYFIMSVCCTPEWKGECRHGWIDCFHYGKMVLLPIVLWATAALYAVEIWGVQNRNKHWIVLGFFLGAIVSTACFIHGLLFINWYSIKLGLNMIVPLYVSIWYIVRSVQLIRSSGLNTLTYLYALLGSLPFWVASVILSLREYVRLPNDPPRGCFVITAAMRGHEAIVGPFIITHRLFRLFYNVFGPKVAGLICNPWIADIAYIFFKPVEIAARFILFLTGKKI